jgi:hypothetical protein
VVPKDKSRLGLKNSQGSQPLVLPLSIGLIRHEKRPSRRSKNYGVRNIQVKPLRCLRDKYAGQEMTPEMRQRIKDEIDARTDDLTRLQVEANHRTRMNKILKEANERAAKPTPEAGKVMDDIASLQRALLTFDGATITRDVSDKKFITEKGGIRKKGKQEGDIGIQEVTTEPAPPTPDVTVPGDVPTAPQEMVEEALKDVEGLIERSLMGILARGLGFEAPPPRPLSEIQAQIEEEGKTPRGTGGVVPAPVRPPQTPTVALPTQPGQQPIELTQEQIDEMRAQRTEERKEIDEQWEQDAGLFVLENLRALEKQLGRPLRTAESETQVLDLLRRMSRGEMVDPGFVFDPEADTHILKPAPLDTKLAESVYYATVFYDAYAAMNPKYGAAPRTEEQVLFNRMQGFEETEGYGPQGYTELSAFQIAADEYVENRNWEARQEIRRRIRAAQDRKLSAPPGIVEEGTPTETTAGDILRNMATKGNKIAKELVKKLDLAFLDMVPVEYNPNINRSFYDGKKDRIVLAGNNDQIKMHEALHAALAHHINSNPESAREIEKLMDAFRKQAEAMGLQDAQSVKYALKSVHEFMSQALSDPLTQTILEAAPSKEAATGLRAFIQKIMKFFGLGPKFEGALNDVVAMAGRISQESSHQRMMEIMRAAQPVDGYPQTVQEAIARLQAGLNEVHHYGPERITEFDPTVSSLLHFFAAPVADVHKSGLWQPKVLSRFTIRPDAKFLEVQDSEAPLHAENIIEGLRGQVTEEELGSYFRRLGRAGDMDAQQDEAVRIARELGYDGIVYMNGAELEYLPTFGVFHQGVLEPVEEQDSIYYAPEGVETETKEGFELDLDQVDEKTKSITPPTFKDYLKRMGRDIQKKLSNYFEVTSEQLRKIDEKYMHQLRQYEYRAMRKTRTHLRMIEPFIQKLEGLSNKEYNRLHYMFLNPHIKDEKSGKTLHELGLAFLKKKNMLKEWLSVQAVLDNIEERADSVGYRFHRLPMYIPRTVTDYKGLRDFLIDRAVKEGDKPGLAFLHSLKKRAGKMTDDEQKAMWVQAVLRGSVPGVPQPKSVKTRSLNRVPLEAVQFYGRLEDALIGHVYEMNDRIEQRVTVGAGYLKRARLSKKMRRLEAERKKLEAKPKRTKDDDKRIKQIDKALTKLDARYDALPDILDEMAESLTDKLRDDDSLTPDQRIEVARLFNARFRQTGMHGALQELKNIGLMMTLGNPLAAITQLGDQALNIYKHGNLFKGDTHAFKGMFKAMSDRGFLDEMELDKSTREFAMGASTQILDKILTASGLKTMDLFGKNAFMLAANEKYKDMSREKFMEQWGAEGILVNAEAAWQSFQDGNVAENEDALYVLYSDLADMQPINLSETPPGYQELENGRIFYMLKTFAVKQVNNVMRESVQEWKKGNKQKAVVQTTALIMLLSLSGAGADEIKDIIIGREKSMSDHVVDNMFQLILMSKYNIDKGLQQGNFTQAVAQGMLPPTRYIDDMISDVGGFLSGDTTYKSLRNVPLGGRIIYSRFTPQGREKELSMQRQDILKDAREGKNMSSEIGRFNKLRRELGREGRENVKAITSDTLKRAREAERKKQLGL